MSLEKSFSDYLDMFLPEVKKLKLYHRYENGDTTFFLKDIKGKTKFVFYYFKNLGYGTDLNCPNDFYNEIRAYFDEETDNLILDWFTKEFDISLQRVYATDLVKLL